MPAIVLHIQDSLLQGAPKEVDCFQTQTGVNLHNACPITWENKLHLFGGNVRQISRLDGHVLKRIGTLLFDHFLGSCTAIQNKKIVLCFSSKEAQGRD